MIYNYIVEIKNRIFLIILAWIFLILVSYCYKETILFTVVKPNLNSSQVFYFITINITDTIYVYLQLTYFVSFQLTCFFTIYHLFKFLTPALYRKEYNIFIIFIIFTACYWLLMNYIFNKIIFPSIFNFFFQYHQKNSIIIKIYFESQFIDYIQMYCFNFYIIYSISQLFTILLIYLNKLKTHTHFIKKYRKFFYTIFLLQGTFLTPPDVFSQIYVIIGLILVYEVLIITIILKKQLYN